MKIVKFTQGNRQAGFTPVEKTIEVSSIQDAAAVAGELHASYWLNDAGVAFFVSDVKIEDSTP